MINEELVLLKKKKNGVTYLTLNRPRSLNALNRELISELAVSFAAADSDTGCAVVVLGAVGDRAFCAGIDLKERNAEDQQGVAMTEPWRSRERSIFEFVLQFSKPVICAINGAAVGGGCELALACDIRFASRRSVLGFPEAKRGLGATFGSQMLPRLVPRCKAYEWLYTGELISAEEASRWGLINDVVGVDELNPTASACAERIAANAPLSIRRYKAAMHLGLDLPLDTALRLDVGPNPYTSHDRREGIEAFLEKRPPKWSGV